VLEKSIFYIAHTQCWRSWIILFRYQWRMVFHMLNCYKKNIFKRGYLL